MDTGVQGESIWSAGSYSIAQSSIILRKGSYIPDETSYIPDETCYYSGKKVDFFPQKQVSKTMFICKFIFPDKNFLGE